MTSMLPLSSFSYCMCLSSNLKVYYSQNNNVASTTGWMEVSYRGINYSRHGNFPNTKLRSEFKVKRFPINQSIILVNNAFNPTHMMSQDTSFLGLLHSFYPVHCIHLPLPLKRPQAPYVNYSIQFPELCMQKCGTLSQENVLFYPFLREGDIQLSHLFEREVYHSKKGRKN